MQAWSTGPADDAWTQVDRHRLPRPAPARVVRTAPRALLRQLDELPMPKRDALDLQPYLTAWRERHGKNAISVSTMRGCPYTCRWCSRAVYGESYRRRSPRLVADEIEGDRRPATTPDTLWFVDDVFTIDHRWLEELTVELERRKLRVPYECITRADRLNEKVVGLLKRSGCFRVWIGAESGSQKVLDAMDRRVTVEQVRDMIQLSKKHGIETGTFIMIGYPGETEADIEATIEHLKRADPDQFTITVAYPIKGTPFHDEVKKDIVELRPWNRTTDRDTSAAAPALVAVLRAGGEPGGQRGALVPARAAAGPLVGPGRRPNIGSRPWWPAPACGPSRCCARCRRFSRGITPGHHDADGAGAWRRRAGCGRAVDRWRRSPWRSVLSSGRRGRAGRRTCRLPLLEPGRHAVGWRAFVRSDFSRPYRRRLRATEPGARPILFAVWYPAQKQDGRRPDGAGRLPAPGERLAPAHRPASCSAWSPSRAR